MVTQDRAEVGQTDEALPIVGEQADPGCGDARVDQEASDEEERRPHPQPRPDAPVLGRRQATDQPIGDDDVEDEDHRNADDGAHQERNSLGVHGGLSLSLPNAYCPLALFCSSPLRMVSS